MMSDIAMFSRVHWAQLFLPGKEQTSNMDGVLFGEVSSGCGFMRNALLGVNGYPPTLAEGIIFSFCSSQVGRSFDDRISVAGGICGLQKSQNDTSVYRVMRKDRKKGLEKCLSEAGAG